MFVLDLCIVFFLFLPKKTKRGIEGGDLSLQIQIFSTKNKKSMAGVCERTEV